MDAKTLCLGVLTLGEASGYEIKKQVEEGPFSHFHHTSYGAIYPALRKLLEDGFVTCQEVAQTGRPDKKVYALTEDGRSAFLSALRRPPERDHIRIDTFAYLFFGHLMDARFKREVFESYLSEIRKQQVDLAEWDLRDASPERLFEHGFGMEYYRLAVDYMERNRAALFPEDEAEEAAQ